MALQAKEETFLEGVVPGQAALHAVLTKIRDLGLLLLSTQQVEEKNRLERFPISEQLGLGRRSRDATRARIR